MTNLVAMRSYCAAMWRCRYFWLSLVRMDLRLRYRRSMLGIGWSLLQPLAMTVVLCIVFRELFNQDLATYGPFLLSGLTFWNFISTVTIHGCQTFFLGEPYIRQHPAPMAIYPLRTMLGAAFHFGLGLVVVLAMTWCFRGIGPVAPLISLAPTLVLLLVLGWSLAILAGFANVMFPDMQHLLEVGLQLVFYATPIIYPPDLLRSRGAGWIVDFNPASALVDLVRQPILYGQFPSAMTLLIASGTCFAAATLATLTLARWQRRLVFYL